MSFAGPERHDLDLGRHRAGVDGPEQCVEAELRPRRPELARLPIDEPEAALLFEDRVDLPDERHAIDWLYVDEVLSRTEPLLVVALEALVLLGDGGEDRFQARRSSQTNCVHLGAEPALADLDPTDVRDLLGVDWTVLQMATDHAVEQGACEARDRVLPVDASEPAFGFARAPFVCRQQRRRDPDRITLDGDRERDHALYAMLSMARAYLDSAPSQPGIIWCLGNRLSDLSPLTRAVVLGLAAVLALMIGAFGAFRVFGSGSVLGDVELLGVAIGGLTEEEAAQAIDGAEAQLLRTPILVDVGGRTTDVTGEQVGGGVEPDLLADAMENGREGSVFAQLLWWIGSLFSAPVELDTGFGVNPTAVDQVADIWDTDLIDSPPFPGAIRIDGGAAVAEYPRAGVSVERDGLSTLLTEAILAGTTDIVPISTVTTTPAVEPRELDAATARANLWIGNPITLTTPDGSQDVVFGQADLANAFVADVSIDGEIELTFDEAIIGSYLLNQRDLIETAPVDAELEIDGYDVVIRPGRNGTLIDEGETVAALVGLADTASRRGTLPVEEGAEPEVTTEDLDALGIEHMVIQFTTYHDCCAARVTNIQLMADTVDGAIIGPGDTFGINEFVGQRTLENGYLDAGTIIRGEIVETVGGGVSQFATTLYNSVFWGGYEDVQHKPHSFYFSRYPEGIESTVSFPQPEMSFRNDTDRSIMIRTSYTDTSITVRIYGFNDGRIVAGAHRNGSTNFEIIAEGGADAKVVRGSVSDRTDFTEPTTEYRANPELTPEDQVETQSPREGWTVVVTRAIEQRGSEAEQRWTVRYLPQRQILEVHPCNVPDSEITCPTTTTLPPTTLPPESTDDVRTLSSVGVDPEELGYEFR